MIHGTTSGVMTAPTLVPELKMPVASARSRLGNHSATLLIAAGKLPPSPRPSAKRAAMKPATEGVVTNPTVASRLAAAGPNVVASAQATAARLHTIRASAYPALVPTLSISRPASISPIAYAVWNAKTMLL